MENKNEPTKNYIYSIDAKGMAALVIGLAIVTLAPLFLFKREIIIIGGSDPFFLLGLVLWFIIHEFVHGISYRISNDVKSRDISYGAKLEKAVFFCICKAKLSKANTIRSLLAPLFILGVVTIIIGFLFGIELLIILSIANICGAAGDILISIFILRMPKNMIFTEDKDNNFVIITNEDISQRKSYGVKLLRIEDDFEKIAPTDPRKFVISKWSYIIFGLLFVYTVLSYMGIISFI